MRRLTRGLPNLSREAKFSGAKGDREIFIFPVQLTTSRIGNLTRLILTLAICDDHTCKKGRRSDWQKYTVLLRGKAASDR